MGRPQKQTAEYFPHYVGGDRKTIFVLEDRWGNEGYAFWYKLLELLCKSDGHYYNFQEDKEFLIAFTKVPEERALEIIQLLIERGKLDQELWEHCRVIWCQHLVDNLQSLYSKRTCATPTRPDISEFREITDEDTRPKRKATKPKAAKQPTAKPEKKHYAEFVSMTEKEYSKLIEQYGEEKTKRMVELLDNYKGSSGHKYESDYRAILKWVVGEVTKKFSTKGGENNVGFTANRENNLQPTQGEFRPSDGFGGNR